jgi:hypothetical protein
MSAPDSTNIHRYLDEVFADVPRSPESSDLKEELRGNLQSRVNELEAAGTTPETAAVKAIRELGPIRDILRELGESEPAATPSQTAVRLMALNRVKPSPFYVVRTVVLALLLTAGTTVVALGATHVLDLSIASLAIIAILSGAIVGVITVDALVHETSQHYPMPGGRAVGFGAAALAGFVGLAFVGLFLGNVQELWLLVTGCVLAFASLVAFISLGVTQTNRMKPWVKDMQKAFAIEDRFSTDPAAAARFGIYTVVIWVIAIGVFIGLTIVVGFAWSWIALVVGLAVFMLVLARMLFPAGAPKK